jgi:uncharacterized protein (DUF433 family)
MPENELDLYEFPAYGVSEAAHYLRLPYQTLRYWLTGFSKQKPIILMAGDNRLSFMNLLECHVLAGMRRYYNLRLPKVRSALLQLEKQSPSRHPLVDRPLETNGVDLFLRDLGGLVNLSRHGQSEMGAFLEVHLQRIEHDPSGLFRFFPFVMERSGKEPKFILIDPKVGFGKPVIAGTGIHTATVVARFNARESVDDLAREYGRTKQEIEEAIRWEQAQPIAA